jgi:hypothetical protein
MMRLPPLTPTSPHLSPTLGFPPEPTPTPTFSRGVGVVGGEEKSHPVFPHLGPSKPPAIAPQNIAAKTDREGPAQ